MRNPFDALVAERTRQRSGGSHTRQPMNEPVQYGENCVAGNPLDFHMLCSGQISQHYQPREYYCVYDIVLVLF